MVDADSEVELVVDCESVEEDEKDPDEVSDDAIDD